MSFGDWLFTINKWKDNTLFVEPLNKLPFSKEYHLKWNTLAKKKMEKMLMLSENAVQSNYVK